MKLKTDIEIKALAKESAGEPVPDSDLIAQWKCYVGGYEKGYTQAQQDLLSQASKGFEEYAESVRGKDAFNPCDNDWTINEVEKAWQACSLSNAKKMQEKDAEIEALTKEKDAWKTMYLELRNRVAGA